MGSIRRGLPHLYSTRTEKGNWTPSLSVEEFFYLTKDGKVHLANLTEKTDGATFLLGFDRWGFFTQHSGSGDMRARVGSDHIMRAALRAEERGIELNKKVAYAFDNFHNGLHSNVRLQEYLSHQYEKYGEIIIRGEIFNRGLASKGAKRGELRFVHTSYSTKNMGKCGSFILHSQLEDNIKHRLIDVTSFNDSNITFDDDRLDVESRSVNVQEEVTKFCQIVDRFGGGSHEEPFNEIKKMVSEKVTRTISEIGIKNKWGSGSEGLVVHPSDYNPEAPRFKITSREFQEAKVNSKRF